MKKIHRRHLWPAYILIVAVWAYLLFLNFYPIRSVFDSAVKASTQIFDRHGVLLYETLNPQQGRTTPVGLNEISRHLIRATIAAEDKSFYANSGIDFEGIARAAWLNLKARRVVSGGSTITQQLVRNVLGVGKKRTIAAKIKESLFALRAAQVFSKDEILTMYFNKVYYGNLNYGVAAAAMGYFGKQPRDLDLAESAFLAGLPQAPNRYDPFKNKDAALARKNYVLELMKNEGMISQTQLQEAHDEKLVFQDGRVAIRAPHFVQYVLEEMEDRFGPEFVTQGLKVATSLDYALQERTQGYIQRNLRFLAGRNVTNASVVALDAKTSEILVMAGSADFFNEEIDGKVNIAMSARQPGSALKPITYAAAFEKGWTGATLIKDEPVRFFTADQTPYYPKNYDFEYHGEVTAREALANSYNIPAVAAIQFAGVESVLQKMRAMGLGTLTESADHYGLALTLGDGEVRLLDLTAAYAIFARGGIKKTPVSILHVREADGNEVYRQLVDTGERVVGEDVSFMVTDILADNGARLPEFGLNNVLQLDRPAAVKTGTTRNFRDNWTVGFTPQAAVGAWVGNSNNEPMHRMSGVYGAGPLWRDVMNELHRTLSKEAFAIPAGLERRTFCVATEATNKEERTARPESSEGGAYSAPTERQIPSYKDGKCAREVREWVSPSIARQPPPTPSQKLAIKKPFDGDVFQYATEVTKEAQQIRFEAQSAMTAEIQWFVNREAVGVGASIFWPLELGEFLIEAVSGEEKAAISISVVTK